MSRRSVLIAIVLSVFWALPASLSAEDLQVDREELASFGDQSVQFINYVGPYEFVNTLDQIRGIGNALAVPIEPGISGESSVDGKYRILHIVSPNIDQGLDADVFIIENDAAVDHIDNLRTIIAGYLEDTYGYQRRDAFLIAEFISYYNAVHRGDLDFVQERYKSPVVDVLDQEKIGIDTHYSRWAGQTQMLIPLRGIGSRPDRDTPPEVDTGAITEDEVIEEMRQDEDMGLDSRREMVELIEEDLDQAQAELDEEREELDQRQEAVEEELREIQDRDEQGTPEPGDEERREELEDEREQIEEQQVIVEDVQEDLDERTEAVLEMRDEIAADENTLMEREDDADDSEDAFVSAPVVEPVWFLMVDAQDDGIPYGRIVKYNLANGRRLAISRLTAVRGRTLAVLPDALLVIAGMEGPNSRVRPMLVDRDSLETIREGDADVFPGSLMTVKGRDIYLVTQEQGSWRLGRFDTALDRKAVSTVEVEPWTSISFDGSSVFVQGAGGEILQLSASTLEEQAVLE